MFSKEVINELVTVVGKENVISELEDLVTYSFDATAAMPRVKPDVVVTPLNTEHVVKIVEVAKKYEIPIYPRGSGTNLSGGTIPLEKGIVVSMVHMNKILEVDLDNRE